MAKKAKKSKKISVGIDESGRGPIIGPMVMVAIAANEEQVQKLIWLGVKDSKLLSREAREEMFDRIHEIVEDFRVEVIEPCAIDASLRDVESNLNWLEADSSARMASELKPSTIIVDCPSINVPAYTAYFKKKLDSKVADKAELLVMHKADEKYHVVGAASVVAKVVRDRIIDHLKDEVGIDFGSGYLGEAKTRNFLAEHFDNPKCKHLFRKMWKPYQKLAEEKKQRSLGDY
tara:strand:+ start:42 stop:737 length:696 start_codon:yes stop_codon:yes gene_type:complete